MPIFNQFARNVIDSLWDTGTISNSLTFACNSPYSNSFMTSHKIFEVFLMFNEWEIVFFSCHVLLNCISSTTNRVCKIIRTCSIEWKPCLEVTQHYEIWARIPQLVILEARINCRSFLNPLSPWELNDLKQRLPVMAAVAMRKKVISTGDFSPCFYFQSLNSVYLSDQIKSNCLHWLYWKSESNRTEPNELDELKYSK